MNAAVRCREPKLYVTVCALALATLGGCRSDWVAMRLESAGVAFQLPGKVKCGDAHRNTSDGRWDGVWCASDTNGSITWFNHVFSVHELVVRRFPASLGGLDVEPLVRASEAPEIESRSALLADLQHRKPAPEVEQNKGIESRRGRTLGGVMAVERTISFPDSRGSFVSKELFCVHEGQLIVLRIFGFTGTQTEREWGRMVDSFAFLPGAAAHP